MSTPLGFSLSLKCFSKMNVYQMRNSSRTQRSLTCWKIEPVVHQLRHVCPLSLYSGEALRWFHYLFNAFPLRDLLNVIHCHSICDQQHTVVSLANERTNACDCTVVCSPGQLLIVRLHLSEEELIVKVLQCFSPSWWSTHTVIYLKQVTTGTSAFMFRLMLISHPV